MKVKLSNNFSTKTAAYHALKVKLWNFPIKALAFNTRLHLYKLTVLYDETNYIPIIKSEFNL